MTALPVGRAQLRREGRSGLAILAFGALVEPARKIAERLDATLVNMRFVKPLDEELIIDIAARHRALVTIEENAIMGGAGSGVGEVLAANGSLLPLLHIGIPDRFIEHGTRDTCLAEAGLDLAGLELERRDLVGAADAGEDPHGSRNLRAPRPRRIPGMVSSILGYKKTPTNFRR